MPIWPSTIPFEPDGETYSEVPELGFYPIGQASSMSISFTLRPMDRAAYAQFQAWFDDETRGGTMSFTAIHPLTRKTEQFVFSEPYRTTVVGVYMSVHLELLLRP